MKLSLGEAKPVRLDDGAVFMVVPVRMHGSAFSASALVVNAAIREKAAALLPSAQSMANSKSTHCNFLRRSLDSLIEGGSAQNENYLRAEQEFKDAVRRVEILFALAKGENNTDRDVVGVEDWRSILFFFHQDVSVGAVEQVEG